MVTAQRYYDWAHEQTSTAGSVSTYKYSANGLYDPDITGTGDQPMGWDQMMLLYNQACCLRSRIQVTFVAEATSPAPMRCCVYISPDSTAVTDPMAIIGNGLCATGILAATSGGSPTVLTLSLELDVAKYFGREKFGVVNDPEMHSTASSNPTEQVYFFVASWAAANTTTCTLGFDTIIEYDSLYNEPRKLAKS